MTVADFSAEVPLSPGSIRQQVNQSCALTGHKVGSKAFNRYRKIDEDTNRKTMSYLE